jgi:hypothetical protein
LYVDITHFYITPKYAKNPQSARGDYNEDLSPKAVPTIYDSLNFFTSVDRIR